MKPDDSSGSTSSAPDASEKSAAENPAPEAIVEPPKNLEFVEVPPDEPISQKPPKHLPPLPKEPGTTSPAPVPQPAAGSKVPAKPAARPIPAKPARAKPDEAYSPVRIISVAVIIFLILAATAYYAYTKSQ